jgi:type I restriction enzyme M protein
VLFGSSNAHKQIRQEIIENHKLDAVISMPSGVFKPYAGVSTAVLFFTKTGTGGTDKVWFYDMQADGYTLDDKRAETKDNDIQDIVSRYHNLTAEVDRKRTDKSFLVPFADIQTNDWDLSINRYKEVVYDEVTYAQPSVIIQDIKNLQEDNKQKLLILEELLK